MRAYPATTEHMPLLDRQLLPKTLDVRHKVPSGVVFSRSTPALPINTSGPDPAVHESRTELIFQRRAGQTG